MRTLVWHSSLHPQNTEESKVHLTDGLLKEDVLNYGKHTKNVEDPPHSQFFKTHSEQMKGNKSGN